MKINTNKLKEFSNSRIYSQVIKDFVFYALNEGQVRDNCSNVNYKDWDIYYKRVLYSLKWLDIVEDFKFDDINAIIINFDELNEYNIESQHTLIKTVKMATTDRATSSFSSSVKSDLSKFNLLVSEVELLKVRRERKLKQVNKKSEEEELLEKQFKNLFK